MQQRRSHLILMHIYTRIKHWTKVNHHLSVNIATLARAARTVFRRLTNIRHPPSNRRKIYGWLFCWPITQQTCRWTQRVALQLDTKHGSIVHRQILNCWQSRLCPLHCPAVVFILIIFFSIVLFHKLRFEQVQDKTMGTMGKYERIEQAVSSREGTTTRTYMGGQSGRNQTHQKNWNCIGRV